MSVPILATKLFIPPPRPGIVLRPRLIERLSEGLRGTPGVILISAPAGFGKTTLLSEWVAALSPAPPPGALHSLPVGEVAEGLGVRVAWLSLDEGDGDPARFLAYLIAALRTVAPAMGEGALGVLHAAPPQSPPTESILTALLNEITAFPEHFLLVLDDYHVIDARAVDQALTFLIDHLPPQMHLVIATREDPDLPLARLRARAQLTELRAADLRFTSEEAAEFLQRVMGLPLSAENISALESRTEGWIAGLQLAALSMQGIQDTDGFIQSFTGSHHFILDYLLEEVLKKQPEGIQSFLLRTSILDRLCGSLCDAVLRAPTASGQETLEFLERTNLFIVALDNERQWYRYHRLFADLLRQRLHQRTTRVGEDGTAEYHHRASGWYEQNGYLAEAFHHAIAAGDFEQAASLAEMSWQTMDRSFQSAVWLGWMKKLPDQLIRLRPVLSTQYAQALMDVGELEAGERRLKDAEQWLDTEAGSSGQLEDPSQGMVVVDEEQFRTLPVRVALVHAYAAQARGDVPGAVKYAELAQTLSREEDDFSRGGVAAFLGIAYWAGGELESAHRAMTDWVNIQHRMGNLVFAIASTFVLADLRVAQGRLREAVGTYQEAIQIASAHEEQVQQVMSHLYLGLAMLYHEIGDQEATARHLLKCRELGEQTALPDWPWRWRLAQARLKESEGEFEAALELLDEAKRLYVRVPIPDIQPIASLKARVYARQGKVSKALDWAREQGLSVDDELSYLHEFEHITLARVLILESKGSNTDRPILEALRLLERLRNAAEEGGRMGSVIEVLVLQSLAHQAKGNISQALACLERALTLAEPEGYLRLFVDEGIPMEKLLSEAADQKMMPDYVARLLAAFRPEKTGEKSNLPSVSPAQPLIEPLSGRELDVLRLVAQGLSNDEISKRLFLALSTVKGHNLRIFAKLQAKSRTEAVARARELDLL